MSWAVCLHRVVAGGLLYACVLCSPLSAEKLALAVSHRGNWDTAIADLGIQAGIFKKHGLELEILYTHGGSETLQAVVSGGVDIGLGVGTLGVLGAYAKGVPLRILGAQSTGAADFWYVRADSKIGRLQDATATTTIAYSNNGSSTHSVVQTFIKLYRLAARPTATGSPPATFTQVMSGQIDIGWSSPPFAFDAVATNRIRIIARATDVPPVLTATIRVTVVTEATLTKRRDTLRRFMAAYRETVEWMYAGEEALVKYAELAKTTLPLAHKIRAEFFPKAMLNPDRIQGMEQLMEDAVAFKAIARPLTEAQIGALIQIPPR